MLVKTKAHHEPSRWGGVPHYPLKIIAEYEHCQGKRLRYDLAGEECAACVGFLSSAVEILPPVWHKEMWVYK